MVPDSSAPSQGTAYPTRRMVVGGLLGGGLLAGGAGLAELLTVDPVSPPTPPPEGTWPRPSYDAAGSGYNSSASPPTDPEPDWTTSVDVAETARVGNFAVGPEAVYAAWGNAVALDRATGEPLWRDDEFLTGTVALSTAGLHVGSSRRGRVVTFTREGDRRWMAGVPGKTETLLPAGETLYAGASAGVAALDSGTGARRWTTDRRWAEDLAALNGRLYARDGGLRQFGGRSLLDSLFGGAPDIGWRRADAGPFVAGSDALVVSAGILDADGSGPGLWCLAPGDGSTRWRALPAAPFDRDVLAGPRVVTDRVAVSTVEVEGRPTTRVVTHCLSDGERVWTARLDRDATAYAAVGDAVLVGTEPREGESSAPTVRAYALADGRELWQVSLPRMAGAEPTRLAAVGGTVVVAAEDGTVTTLR